MTALATGLVLGQLLGAVSTFTIGDRTEARVRSATGTVVATPGAAAAGGATQDAGADVETAVFTGLLLRWRKTTLSLFYVPRFTYVDITGDPNRTFTNSGRVDLGITFTRNLQLGLSVDGSIGTQNTAGLAAPILNPTTAVGAVPGTDAPPGGAPTALGPPTPSYILPQGNLYLGSARGSGSLTYRFARRWAGGITGSYGIAGGIDYLSQQVAPPNRAAFASVQVGYLLTARDTISTQVRGSDTVVLTTPAPAGFRPNVGGTFLTASVAESWQHAFSVHTQGAFELGVTYLNAAPADDSPTTGQFSGTGFANLTHTAPYLDHSTLTFQAATGVVTAYNPIVGEVQQSAVGTVGAAYTRDKVGLALLGSAVSSIPFTGENTTRIVSGSATATYRVGRYAALSTGVRGSTQLFPNEGQDIPAQWVVFAAFQFALRPIHL